MQEREGYIAAASLHQENIVTHTFARTLAVLGAVLMTAPIFAADLTLKLNSQKEAAAGSGKFQPVTREETWDAQQTAVIVCDVWDAHHCLNAVRRLEESAPRMNEVLKEARKRGATIVHSPSDCMAAYEDHPARKRAINAPAAKNKPKDVEFWCSRIPSEEKAVYPIDQSDGGEDDDPAEHVEWAAKLKAMGRNPGMPWKTQSKLIEIDADRDFISDRGDEVWNVLESRGIKNVILVGVHLNMCVLGRPFGVRQMVRNGKNVVVMRDMTDCMYNPKRWPHVDHFTGNDLVIAHVERFICPTITSDQLLGGEPFQSKYDNQRPTKPVPIWPHRPYGDWVTDIIPRPRSATMTEFGKWDPVLDWGLLELVTPGVPGGQQLSWYRCVVRLPKSWADAETFQLKIEGTPATHAWLNGHEAVAKQGQETERGVFQFSSDAFLADDYNLLVLRYKHASTEDPINGLHNPPLLLNGANKFALKGRWQFRIGDDKSWSNIPLPAKFGGSPDMLFEPDR